MERVSCDLLLIGPLAELDNTSYVDRLIREDNSEFKILLSTSATTAQNENHLNGITAQGAGLFNCI